MKQKELEKPEDYESGGKEKLSKTIMGNIIQIGFLLFLIVWVISSLSISVSDVVGGEFSNKWLSYSFIGGILTSGYLITTKYVKNKKLGIKKPKKKGCSKCGKNKTINP